MGRAPCCDKNGLKKGPWTPEEDLKLIDYIQNHGAGNWRTLPKSAGLQRCGKSCRLRWTNYLRPDIKRGRFSFEEEETIIQLHSILGNKWSAIAARLPGRTDNEIKNYWNTHIRKRLLRMGIDPVTHAPRLDFGDLSTLLTSSLCNPALLNLSNLLNSQLLINPDILRLASALSSLKQNPDMQLPQNPQLLSQFQQLLMQANAEGVLSNNAFGCPTTTQPPPQNDNNNSIGVGNLENDVANSQQQDWSYLNGVGDSNPQNSYLQCLNSELSTPLSSPTPLNSSSTYINSCSTTEDERESFCSDFFKFEIPEGLDINQFM